MRFYFGLISILFLTGCAAPASRLSLAQDLSLPPMPMVQPVSQVSVPDTVDFEDISLSAQKRYQALTSKMAIAQATDKYLTKGQASMITRPDGTLVFPYGLSAPSLVAKKMMYSKVILQEGEKIMSVAAGDTARWEILPNYIGDATVFTPVVLIKPLMGGLETSLSIITNKRDYDILIESVEDGDYMPRLSFYYPQDKADAIAVGLPPERLEDNESSQPRMDMEHIQYDYRVQGDSRLSWYPLGVFEDGHKVFIKMSDLVDRSQLPVFMSVDPGGQVEVVNYRYCKPYYVVDTVFNQGLLILGSGKYRQSIHVTRIVHP